MLSELTKQKIKNKKDHKIFFFNELKNQNFHIKYPVVGLWVKGKSFFFFWCFLLKWSWVVANIFICSEQMESFLKDKFIVVDLFHKILYFVIFYRIFSKCRLVNVLLYHTSIENYSSEVRGLWMIKCSSKLILNLPSFMY